MLTGHLSIDIHATIQILVTILFLFQDNAPVHKAKRTREPFETSRIPTYYDLAS